uniref:Uncharacterized protein n=1 Tax=Meloidogyne enterolobii TaxID=390850 RepID=A0A6V7WRH2_MELEN|nr:unnamed protein product [Meloidogyne enterolobii]
MNLLHFYKVLCWERIFVFFLFLIIYVQHSSEDVIDQWTRQGTALIEEAKIVGGQIRQCTCAEQRACIVEMQEQAMGCIDTCWNMFSKITVHPDKLRVCFGRADAIIENFIKCFEDNVDSCLPNFEDKKIPKVNITELFRLGVEKIEKTQKQLTKSLTDGPIRKIINTASEFGVCVKDCFLAKNPNKFCFDKKDCQPLLLDTKATKSLRRCTKMIDWKKESGDLCECSVKSGINDLHQYCPMLKLIGGGQKGKNKSTGK